MLIIHLGPIEVSIANLSKCDRNKTEEVYVTSFVPSYLLPNKRLCSLDPFLDPSIKELEDLFISGNFISGTLKFHLHRL